MGYKYEEESGLISSEIGYEPGLWPDDWGEEDEYIGLLLN